jgi:sugar phosphate isomerase/epimerase
MPWLRASKTPSFSTMLRSALLAMALLALAQPALAQRFDGFNVIVAPDHPFGSASARQSLAAAKSAGARAIAIVPFLWQRDPQHPEIVRGNDLPDGELRLAIREARALGLMVMVKPHVWVDGSWAGAVNPPTEQAWNVWFGRYRAEVARLARIAAEEGADALSIGTELKLTTQHPQWRDVIAAARSAFAGTLLYVAHNVEEAETVPFWPELDAVGVSLYPPLGADDEREARRAVMRGVAGRLDALAVRTGKPVIVAEIGLRSAVGAAAKPWESAEERAAPPNARLQAEVLSDWLDALERPAVRGVLIWRWFTDPAAGGPADTDFTVQGKMAERVLNCRPPSDCR